MHSRSVRGVAGVEASIPLKAFLLLGAVAAVFFLGCSPAPAACDASNCSGCCDQAGVCQSGFVPSACGARGGACVTCGPQDSCSFGFCVAPQPCVPKSCVQAGANCGSLPDGCG